MLNRAGALIFAIALLLSLNIVALKIAIPQSGPLTVQALATMIAAVALLLASRNLRADGKPVQSWTATAAISASIAVGSSVGISLGVQRLEAGTAAILLGTTPLCTVGLSRMVLGEHLRRFTLLGIALGLIGVGIVVSSLSAHGDNQITGAFLMLAGTLSWAFGLVLMRKYNAVVRELSMAAWQWIMAVPLLGLLALAIEDFSMAASAPFVLAVGYIGLGGKAVSVLLQIRVVRRAPAVSASMTALLVPVMGIVTGAIILGEDVTWNKVLGALVVVIGVVFVVKDGE